MQEVLRFFPQKLQGVARARQPVVRKFHHKRNRFALKHGLLVKEGDQNPDDDGQHVQADHNQRLVAGKERVDKKRVDRQLCGAAHERRQQNGHLAVTFARQGTRRHDGGNRASEADQQRDDAAAGQAEFSQKFVHDEGHPGNVAAVFQHGKEEEHRHDDRQKAQHASDALKDPVDDQAVKHLVHAGGSQCAVHDAGQGFNPHCEKILKPGADHIEGQVKDQSHHADENGNRGIFARQDLVDLPASRMLAVFTRFFDTGIADLCNKGKPHIGDGCTAVQPALFFHLERDVFQRFPLVVVQAEPVDDQPVALNRLAGGKTHRNPSRFRVVLNQVDHRVEAAVYGAAVLVLITEILPLGLFLILRDMDGMIHQFLDALVLGGGNRHDRHAQHGFHRVHVHSTAVFGHFIHHVQRHHDGNVHFQQLHGQVHVSLNIGDVDNVDDPLRLLLQHEVAGDQFLARIGGHGIDSGQIRDGRICPSQDCAVLAVNRHAREIAHMLFCARKLIEKRRLAAVLVANQSESQYGAVGERIAAALRVETSSFPQPEMLAHRRLRCRLLPDGFGNGFHFYFCGIVQAERQLISVKTDLDRIAHRRIFYDFDVGTRDNPHIQEVLPQRAAAADIQHTGGLSLFDFSQCHISCLFLQNRNRRTAAASRQTNTRYQLANANRLSL